MLSKVYVQSAAVSQSQIKDFDKLSLSQFYRKWILKEEQEDENKFLFGSLVDQLAFDSENLDKEFVVANCELPSELIQKIIRKVFAEVYKPAVKTPRLDYFKHNILLYANELSYGNSWKSDTVYDKIVKTGSDYFSFLSETVNKKVISQEDYNDAWSVVQTLKASPISTPFFDKDQLGIELVYQAELFGTYSFGDLETIRIKGCIDILRWDHVNKTVQIVDLKTTRSIKQFMESIRDYGYGYQLSYYTELLHQHLIERELTDYKIIPPYNLVMERYNKVPHIFVYNDRDIKTLKSGDFIRGIKGWHDTLYDVYWHTHNNEWHYLREMKMKGKIEVTF